MSVWRYVSFYRFFDIQQLQLSIQMVLSKFALRFVNVLSIFCTMNKSLSQMLIKEDVIYPGDVLNPQCAAIFRYISSACI